MKLYRIYSETLKEQFGEKVYKLPVNIKTTCPNRDGTVGIGGCAFCSYLGAGFESHSNDISIVDQLELNKALIQKKYKAYKYIAYFQNYTNTYLPIEIFKQYMEEACIPEIVELDISTRPDCITTAHLDVLKEISQKYHVEVTIELGLQTTNEQTLLDINRGHTVKDFMLAAELIHQYGFKVCCHLILNLPGDSLEDTINSAKLMNLLNIEYVKLHSLYIAKGSQYEQLYIDKKIKICTCEAYEENVITFLEYLDPRISIQRLLGRAPKEESVFCNWDRSWWVIKEEIEAIMLRDERYQGNLWVINEKEGT